MPPPVVKAKSAELEPIDFRVFTRGIGPVDAFIIFKVQHKLTRIIFQFRPKIT